MGHEFSTSAPGTEAFKQDFAKWDVLRKDVALALEQVESSLAQKLSEREAKDRLNAGGDDRAPAEYTESVSRYYRSLAKRQQPKQDTQPSRSRSSRSRIRRSRPAARARE